MKTIKTNKGTFGVRYIFEKMNPVHGKINVIVISDPENKMPFTGTYGDEIPMIETYKIQYNVILENKNKSLCK